ncbi:2Fe-2S iron-sulfur cluster-binding protein [Rhodoferax sp.]|uniref:2Fe-2S iron-sulfur cluster-binding protein n=1 Tax=Rhodoferax sp. TaxID=50421 RepID=UPI00260AF40B|nr:2Fe-2S iron-sulfur cluster-binding protein [Rhodoferax sp.]MDD2926303.1 2Fe-2S iron-sulfur cluster-binding protein [Rhodoferax sp.]
MNAATASTLYWDTVAIPFRPGETIAAALQRHGLNDLGASVGGLRGRYFCGIGTCQACLVSVDGASPVEACLTPAQAGMQLTSAQLVGDSNPNATHAALKRGAAA